MYNTFETVSLPETVCRYYKSGTFFALSMALPMVSPIIAGLVYFSYDSWLESASIAIAGGLGPSIITLLVKHCSLSPQKTVVEWDQNHLKIDLEQTADIDLNSIVGSKYYPAFWLWPWTRLVLKPADSSEYEIKTKIQDTKVTSALIAIDRAIQERTGYSRHRDC